MPVKLNNTAQDNSKKKLNKPNQTQKPNAVGKSESERKAIPPQENETNSDSALQVSQGAGEIPHKPKPKKLKPTERLIRHNAQLANGPKKNAQRAKGSISLNKTIGQVPEAEGKFEEHQKGPPSAPLVKEAEKKQTPTVTKRKKKKVDDKTKKPATAVKETPKSNTSLATTDVIFQSSSEKTLEVVNQEESVKCEEIASKSLGFNACSFLDRIQQGVRAYFSPKSSLSPPERKEGGFLPTKRTLRRPHQYSPRYEFRGKDNSEENEKQNKSRLAAIVTQVSGYQDKKEIKKEEKQEEVRLPPPKEAAKKTALAEWLDNFFAMNPNKDTEDLERKLMENLNISKAERSPPIVERNFTDDWEEVENQSESSNLHWKTPEKSESSNADWTTLEKHLVWPHLEKLHNLANSTMDTSFCEWTNTQTDSNPALSLTAALIKNEGFNSKMNINANVHYVFQETINPFISGRNDSELQPRDSLEDVKTFDNPSSSIKINFPSHSIDNYIPFEIHSSGRNLQSKIKGRLEIRGQVKPSISFNTTTPNVLEEVTNELLHRLKNDRQPASKQTKELQQYSFQQLQKNLKMNESCSPLSSTSFPNSRRNFEKSSTALETSRSEGKQFSNLQALITMYDKISKESPNNLIKSRSLDNFFSAIVSSLNNNQEPHIKSKKRAVKKKRKTKYSNLVATFQKIAKSSFSLTQIATLNQIIAGLQNYVNKDYHSIVSELTKLSEISERRNAGDNSPPLGSKSRQECRNIRAQSKPVIEVKSKPLGQRPKKPKKILRKTPLKQSKTSLLKLEDILNFDFASRKDFKISDGNPKLLVTVQLSGSQVLVNDVEPIQSDNEENLPSKNQNEEISELIIENVTKDKFWYKNTKSSILRILSRIPTEGKHQFQVKVTPRNGNPYKIMKETKGVKRKAPVKVKPPIRRKKAEVKRPKSHFKHDQVRLRTRHPVAEITEAKPRHEMLPKLPSKVNTQNPPKPHWNESKRVLPTKKFKNSVLGKVKSCVFRSNSGRKPENKNLKPVVSLKKRTSANILSQNRTSKSFISPVKTTPLLGSLEHIKGSTMKAELEAKNSIPTPPDAVVELKSKENTEKPSENAEKVLYVSSDVTSQNSSIEFLFSETPSGGTPDTLNNEIGKMPSSYPDDLQKQKSISEVKSNSLNENLETPIIILPSPNCVEIQSQTLESDSFLMSLTTLRMSPTQKKAFLRPLNTNSEVKFYPRNMIESMTVAESVPIPKQNQDVDNTTKEVVDIPHAMEEDFSKVELFCDEEDTCKTELEKIDKFVRELSLKRKSIKRTKARILTQRKPLKTREPGIMRSEFRSLNLTNRKVFHECEKRKLADMNNKKTKCKKIQNKVGVESFVKEKRETAFGDGGRKPNLQEKPTGVITKYRLTALSVKPSDLNPELLEAIKTAITCSEDLTRKEEILQAIEEGFSTNLHEILKIRETDTIDDASRKARKLKIKIKKRNPAPSPRCQPYFTTTEITESMSVTPKTQNESPPVFFDAQEDVEEEEKKDVQDEGSNLPPEDTVEPEEVSENEEVTFDPNFISSVSNLFPKEVHPVMLDKFSDKETLKKVMSLVGMMSRNLMKKVESTICLEVLWLLEEMSREHELQRLESFKNFLEKIQNLNTSRIMNFNKSYSSFSELQDENGTKTLLKVLKKQLNTLTLKISSGYSPERPICSISSSFSLPNLNENFTKTPKIQRDEMQSLQLKKKLQEHLYVLQELIKVDKVDESPKSSTEDLQKEVTEKIKSMEEFRDTTETPEDSEMNLNSLLEISNNCDNIMGSSMDVEKLQKPTFLGNFGFIEIINCLIRTWNAQMPFTCIKNEYYQL